MMLPSISRPSSLRWIGLKTRIHTRGSRAITVLVVSWIALTPAMAQQRLKLPGFQKFNFGMTGQEIKKLVKIIKSKSEGEGVTLNASDVFSMDGEQYKQSFLLMDNHLRLIKLSKETDKDNAGCALEFDKLLGSLQAKYGPPDLPPKQEVVGGVAHIETASFTFQDGGSIALSATSIKSCLTVIAYSQGAGSF